MKKRTNRTGRNDKQVGRGAGPKTQKAAEPDVNQLAHHLVGISTGQKQLAPPTDSDIRRAMAELGRRGGQVGGRRRAENMSQEERSNAAAMAARARWAKRSKMPTDTASS